MFLVSELCRFFASKWRILKEYNILLHENLSPPLYSTLKVHKIENFFGSDFEFCVISLLVMLKY